MKYMVATLARCVHDGTDLVKMTVLTAMYLQLSNADFYKLDHKSTQSAVNVFLTHSYQ